MINNCISPSEINHPLDFESFEEIINKYDIFSNQITFEEEMFIRSQNSAFVPFQRPMALPTLVQQSSIPIYQKMDLTQTDKYASNH